MFEKRLQFFKKAARKLLLGSSFSQPRHGTRSPLAWCAVMWARDLNTWRFTEYAAIKIPSEQISLQRNSLPRHHRLRVSRRSFTRKYRPDVKTLRPLGTKGWCIPWMWASDPFKLATCQRKVPCTVAGHAHPSFLWSLSSPLTPQHYLHLTFTRRPSFASQTQCIWSPFCPSPTYRHKMVY